ncbi:MAG: hypothetical protein ABJP87_04515 [Bauldia litoralis]|uniref:hypothetical protein n=1 Tax=Bauldia litoralis TaxID=665467 RepID=UPI003296C2F2
MNRLLWGLGFIVFGVFGLIVMSPRYDGMGAVGVGFILFGLLIVLYPMIRRWWITRNI